MDYIEINKKSWDNKVDIHVDSEFYDQASFLAGRNSLNEIELKLLGDISGKSILHLQCHFGQDSISMARMGAKVHGVDFSSKAIEKAEDASRLLAVDATFQCCDLYDLPSLLDEQYDIVFASYGVIGWHPELKTFSEIVNRYLKPGGRFVFAEFHPIMWMYDDALAEITYSYFNSKPIEEDEEGTYADKTADIKSKFITWNHSLSKFVEELLVTGMTLRSIKEYDYSPYACWSSCIKSDKGYQIKEKEGLLPMVYSLVMEKE